MKYAEVIIDIANKNVDRIFHYAIPENIKEKICVGMRVFVPFGKGNRIREGYVIGFTDKTDIEEKYIKNIYTLPDEYIVFSNNMIELAKFMADKYYCSLSECLQCIMPKIIKDKTNKYANINYDLHNINEIIDKILKKNNSQGKVLSILLKNDNISIYEIKSILGISLSPIQTLEKNGIIKITTKQIKRDAVSISDYDKTYHLKLNDEQSNALNFIKQKICTKTNKPILLHGVTGSGKTEVYLQVIDEVLKIGKQAIVLVPEISLTPQTVERFIGRFGNKVSVTHSKLSDGERFDQWKKAKDNEISIMVGARSAIFTPFENLGVIIIDEEHESTYKSESTPKYDIKEIAEQICNLTGATLVLGSATPSINTYYKTQNGEYDLVYINNRINNSMPQVNVIDMRKELEKGNMSIFSKALFDAIKENLDNNMQTILFLNRRGHSTFVSCRKCGYVMECKNCNVSYTYHLKEKKLICHYCNSVENIPNICPSCNSKYIRYFGTGTQKIEEQINKYFKNARVMRMDMDTTSKKNSHQNILEDFKNHKADILIGTQMIAKGLDFPKVSLVGVIASDITLNTGDYKSAENTFQLLTQVSGRAGRAEDKGRVFIQTYNPDHYSIQFAKNNDYKGFYEKEILERKIMFYPPFSNIFFIMICGEDENSVINAINFLHKVMIYYNQKTNFYISDVAKAYIYKLNKHYRYKILIKAEEETRLKNFVLYCVNILKNKIDVSSLNIILNLNPNYIQ
ncbi:primosomal protein N' [uncultured Tyzzerella sp.]|uniref:primosomal protein N' n=1 Tax=uncultured Tyzzerella sp. TaxID=2321398 RepID=UPI0029434AA9|nr:primosomal protein N' [uncultured Tyzzerella sp.]